MVQRVSIEINREFQRQVIWARRVCIRHNHFNGVWVQSNYLQAGRQNHDVLPRVTLQLAVNNFITLRNDNIPNYVSEVSQPVLNLLQVCRRWIIIGRRHGFLVCLHGHDPRIFQFTVPLSFNIKLQRQKHLCWEYDHDYTCTLSSGVSWSLWLT